MNKLSPSIKTKVLALQDEQACFHLSVCFYFLLWASQYVNWLCCDLWVSLTYAHDHELLNVTKLVLTGRNFDFGLTMKSFVRSYQEQRLKWHRCTFRLFIWHSLNYRACSGRWLARSLTHTWNNNQRKCGVQIMRELTSCCLLKSSSLLCDWGECASELSGWKVDKRVFKTGLRQEADIGDVILNIKISALHLFKHPSWAKWVTIFKFCFSNTGNFYFFYF